MLNFGIYFSDFSKRASNVTNQHFQLLITMYSSIEAPSSYYLWGVPDVCACATGSCNTGYDVTGSRELEI